MKCYQCKVDMRKIGEREFCCTNTSCPLVCEEFDVQSLRAKSVVQFWFCREREPIDENNDSDLPKQQSSSDPIDSDSSDFDQKSNDDLIKHYDKRDILLYLLFVLCLIITYLLCK